MSTALDPLRGTAASSALYHSRAATREWVRSGEVPLRLVIEGRWPEAQGVELVKLVQWMPSVGTRKAQRLLIGLPHRYHLRMLDDAQLRTLLLRVDERNE